MLLMRTTLTLDHEVAQRLREEAALGKRSFKAIVNDALRRGLGLDQAARPRRYRVQPHSSRFQPGLDLGKLNQLVDELEAVERSHSPRR